MALPKLMDAVLGAWTRCLPPPYGDGAFSAALDSQTDCNKFVNQVAQSIPYTRFQGKRANEMCDIMAEETEWMAVSGEVAQAHANLGAFVVAAWKNPRPDLSGHVCVVIPGTCVTSGKWPALGKTIPKVANVGRPEACRLDRGANYAFADPPAYYVLLRTVPAVS